MTPTQVKLIQESFAKVAPIAPQAAAMFYGRLFEIVPEVKPLFRGDMTEQGRKLMATLAVVVNGLADHEIGQRPVGRGPRLRERRRPRCAEPALERPQ